MSPSVLHVTRNGGMVEPLNTDRMLERLREQDCDLTDQQLRRVIDRTVMGLREKVSTSEIDDQLADCAANLAIEHVNYGLLAARVAYRKYLRSIPSTYDQYLLLARNEGLLSDRILRLYHEHANTVRGELHATEGVYQPSYFALRTLQNGYLLHHTTGKRQPFEHPTYLFMRVALHLFGGSDIAEAMRFYRALVQNAVSVASPILFSAGSPDHSNQLASCFVQRVHSDSVVGMYDTLREMALLMKNLGGIGLDVSGIRCRGSGVRGFNGTASGVVSFLQVAQACCQHISQGGGKRKGVMAAYISMHHPEIFDFLRMRRVDGPEEFKARSIFYGVWVSDLFMRRVQSDDLWSLMCPSRTDDLNDLHGTEFEERYLHYECTGVYEKRVSARHLLAELVRSMIETGTPYVMFKDQVNYKSNHKHLGVIRGSNLCSEICLYFDAAETAVCILGAVVLHRAIRCPGGSDASLLDQARAETRRWCLKAQSCDETDFEDVSYSSSVFASDRSSSYFDFAALRDTVGQLVVALDNSITNTQYAVPSTKRSNSRHRPIGIGVQGLANAFAELALPYDSSEARLLNRLIFEHIYYAAVEASVRLAVERGPFPSFAGSPMSYGQLQPMLWHANFASSGALDWDSLVRAVRRFGTRNSTLTAIMPTATTAQLWNNNESVEPFTTNIFYRRVLSGQFVVVNEQLMRALIERNLWNREMYDELLRAEGSLQAIERVPPSVRELFKTVWEIPQKRLVDLSADRAPFIDQSQSMNIWMAEPTMAKVSSMLMYAWRRGLKTGCYYLRTKPAFHASRTATDIPAACTRSDPDCEACSL